MTTKVVAPPSKESTTTEPASRIARFRVRAREFYRGLDTSEKVLIIANLTPVGGVLFFGWDIGAILAMYWLEHLVLATYAVVKILATRMQPPKLAIVKVFIIPLFLGFYAGLCSVQGLFLYYMGSGDTKAEWRPDIDDSLWLGPLAFIALFFQVLKVMWTTYSAQVLWPFVGLYLSHGVSFIENYLRKGEYRLGEMRDAVKAPYDRAFLLHVAVCIGAFPVVLFGSPWPLLLLLVFGKTALDLHLHRRWHMNAQEDSTREPSKSTRVENPKIL